MAQFDIILWGATGFTGQLVAEYLACNAEPTVKWAMAGRNEGKLQKVREGLTAVNPQCATLPLIIADSHDKTSLAAMVSQGRVICSTVGPYAKYGTPLVAECVAQGKAYCDLTGESHWIRSIIDAYHEQAQQTGARIVTSCGYDSIPSDLGALVLQEYAMEKYGRYCQAIDHIIIASKGGASGGTVASMINIVEEAAQNPKLRKLLGNPYSLVPGYRHDGGHQENGLEYDQNGAIFNEQLGAWTGPFIMAAINTRVVRRSHALLGFPYGNDFRFSESMRMGRGFKARSLATLMGIGMTVGMTLAAIGPARRLMQRYLPSPGEGPSKEAREKGYFKSVQIGYIPAANGEPERWVRTQVGAKGDPGYAATSVMLGESALSLAFDNLPKAGGILTAASAIGMPLVKRLRAADFTFSPDG